MKKSVKNIIIIAVVAVLTACAALSGFMLNGKNNFVLSFLGFERSQTDSGDGTTNDPEETVDDFLINTRPKKISAIMISAEDLKAAAAQSADKTKAKLEDMITFAADNGFNTVVVELTGSDAASAVINCADGTTDALSVLAGKAKADGVYTAVLLNSELYNSNGLKKLISDYDFDSLILSDKMSYDSMKLALADVRSTKTSLCLGLQSGKADAEQLTNLLDIRRGDFILDMSCNSTSDADEYRAELEKADTVARKSGADFIAGVRVDLIKDKHDEKAVAVIIDQLTVCDELGNCAGALMFDYSEFSSNDAISALVLKFLSDRNSADLQKKFELKNFQSSKKTTNESKITFSGSSSPLYPLELNGKPVKREANGDFSFEVQLKAGDNEFEFKHKDESYKYTVTYEIKILEAVEPTGKVVAPGGSTLKITATALKGATVYASVNGSKVKMTKLSNVVQDEDGTMLDESSDFAVFSGQYTLPKGTSSVQNLGKIKVHASYNGLSATLSAADVSVSAEAPPPTPAPDTDPPEQSTQPPTGGETEPGKENSTEGSTNEPASGTAFDPSKMLTPYSYAGVSGKSKMCEITTLCETMPANVLDDCVPYSSPLPAGTFDYISSEYTYDGSKYYRLASGKNILASRAKLISSGYNLPQNRVTVVKSSSNAEATQIKLGLLWKAPFNIAVKNQTYLPSSQAMGGTPYAVSSFNGRYLDLVFYHTGTVSGKVDVSGSRILSSAKWISDTDNKTLTLRLELKTAGRFYGFNINYTSDGCLTLSVKAKPSSTLKGSVIMIDAGHGGNDSGAICAYNPDSSRKYEKQINLQIAQKIKVKLEANGATVIMTRGGDSTLSLDDRVSLTRRKNPDMFIAVHCDSSTSASPMGTSAYYYQPYSFPLASAVHNRIVKAYKSDIYGGSSSAVLNKVDRGTNMYPFRVTRVEECPAILVEYGFVSNISECKLLWTSSVQDKLAQATVDGIKDYISSN